MPSDFQLLRNLSYCMYNLSDACSCSFDNLVYVDNINRVDLKVCNYELFLSSVETEVCYIVERASYLSWLAILTYMMLWNQIIILSEILFQPCTWCTWRYSVLQRIGAESTRKTVSEFKALEITKDHIKALGSGHSAYGVGRIDCFEEDDELSSVIEWEQSLWNRAIHLRILSTKLQWPTRGCHFTSLLKPSHNTTLVKQGYPFLSSSCLLPTWLSRPFLSSFSDLG